MKSRQLSVAGLLGFVAIACVLCAAAPWIGIVASGGAILVQGLLLFERFAFPSDIIRCVRSGRCRDEE